MSLINYGSVSENCKMCGYYGFTTKSSLNFGYCSKTIVNFRKSRLFKIMKSKDAVLGFLSNVFLDLL